MKRNTTKKSDTILRPPSPQEALDDAMFKDPNAPLVLMFTGKDKIHDTYHFNLFTTAVQLHAIKQLQCIFNTDITNKPITFTVHRWLSTWSSGSQEVQAFPWGLKVVYQCGRLSKDITIMWPNLDNANYVMPQMDFLKLYFPDATEKDLNRFIASHI